MSDVHTVNFNHKVFRSCLQFTISIFFTLDLFSRLSDFKTNIEEKLDIFKKLDEELLSSAGKEQWLIDYICNCLEGLSNTDAWVISILQNWKRVMFFFIQHLNLICNCFAQDNVIVAFKFFLKFFYMFH